MSRSGDEVKEEYDDVIETEKTERMKDTMRAKEKEEKEEKAETRGDSAKVSSAASSIHADDHDNHDLEALATAPTNSPPYSVFSKKEKHFIVCKLRYQPFHCSRQAHAKV